MKTNNKFDAIIIGGSYSGLAAAMALGRALKQVLIIDGGKPCNAPTPYSHNFLTRDGETPAAIASIGRQQVAQYDTVKLLNSTVHSGRRTKQGFEIQVSTGEIFLATKLIFATGIKDIMPNIKGFAECWGISVLHCPYCHGYEVKHQKTGILANGDMAYELTQMISNWTKDLTLFTNGTSTLTMDQAKKLEAHQIKIVETEIRELEHLQGHLKNILFKDGTRTDLKALYAPRPFEQHCSIPEALGCEITDEGYIKVNPFQETSVDGIYACGDATTRMRTVANAVAIGTTAGVASSKKLIMEQF